MTLKCDVEVLVTAVDHGVQWMFVNVLILFRCYE